MLAISSILSVILTQSVSDLTQELQMELQFSKQEPLVQQTEAMVFENHMTPSQVTKKLNFLTIVILKPLYQRTYRSTKISSI
jgi:Tfp pilus assembly protein FimT